ncbi:hypothetical protein BKA66DRAFT_590660 [Pyrenochaeta sp. MPI-SDFR-AT-0127]|nr:hypothetical protein BKA66DRAFT_590660 [Pyrenochaeta sp. MPI-SDFR-AT-0127]
MFSYNYIVPTGPAGYYNYNNQQTTAPASGAPTQFFTPPQSASAGTAQSYCGTAPPQYTEIAPDMATFSLAQLIPAATPMHLPRENVRLAQFYVDVDRLVNLRVPDHETRYIASTRDFEKWIGEVYHPKMQAMESMRAGLEAFQQWLQAFAEDSCRLGTAAYDFLTPHLEIGDVFDLLILVEQRLEEIYSEFLTIDELKIDIESNTNAAECYNSDKTKYAQQWEAYKDNTKTTARRNFHQARTLRKRVHLKKLTHYVTTANQVDTPPYEAIMKAITAIPAINSQQDVNVINRTQAILSTARDQGTYIDGLRFQAHSELMQQEEVYAPMVDADYSQHGALLQRQQQIITDMAQQAANQKKAVEDHYIEWGSKPMLKLLDVFQGTQGLQTAMDNYNGTSHASTPASFVTPIAQATGSVAAGPAPKFQMPLSRYSNMLTQQHVTNMQIMNNVGGGSTNFHLANSSGGIIW